MGLEAAAVDLRAAIDSATELDSAAFARRARNAIAQAVVAAAFAAEETLTPVGHEAPIEELCGCVGPELAADLAAVYEGGAGWTSHAIDALEPLHSLATR
ncbi:MAG: hypothetical protein WAU41_03305 [Gaiellaceae bacterium]